MSNLQVVFHMLFDLVTGGDPTLPSGYPDLVWVARILALIYDLWR